MSATRPTTVRVVIIWACSLLTVPACLQPAPNRSGNAPEPDTRQDSQEDGAVTSDPAATQPDPIVFPRPIDDPGRWLVVEKTTHRTSGAWATGSFDQSRNKLTIMTNDVSQFSIDTDRILIDWDQLVILGIDGRNSELRKRNYSVLHIALDKHGRWVVLEP